jgi:DNA-binding MarR family transcriptional regulator
MKDRAEQLSDAMGNLLRMKDECSCAIFSECGLSDLTVKQMAYLRVIDEHGDVTFSRLSELTRTSKPTVTEMINRCVRMECVYRERSPDDGRIQYVRLTDKGRTIAQAEKTALKRTIERMVQTLDEEEMDLLIRILGKVG